MDRSDLLFIVIVVFLMAATVSVSYFGHVSKKDLEDRGEGILLCPKTTRLISHGEYPKGGERPHGKNNERQFWYICGEK